MEVIVTKKFSKDVDKELDKILQLQLANLIEQIRTVSSLQQLKNIKKLKGYKTAFRVKLGSYRIGFIFETDKIILSRVMHRKEIYRYFP